MSSMFFLQRANSPHIKLCEKQTLKNELKSHFFQKFKKVSSRKVLRLAIVHCMFDKTQTQHISTITSNQLSSTLVEG